MLFIHVQFYQVDFGKIGPNLTNGMGFKFVEKALMNICKWTHTNMQLVQLNLHAAS